VESKDFEGVYLAVAAERGTPSNVYLRGGFDALRWYPRTPTAFIPLLPPREARHQTCISVVALML
jgi:hypothetical protein